MNDTAVKQDVLDAFRLEADLQGVKPYGSGHINDTYRLTAKTPSGSKQYILQHINKSIFKQPQQVMENIAGVTSWLGKKITAAGGDPQRETLHILCAADGKPFYMDAQGEYWRVYDFVENTVCYDQVSSADDFYQSGLSFGNFQRLLADYPAETLHETIPHFHDTPVRYETFEKAVAADSAGRAASVAEEIAFVRERGAYTHTLVDRQAAGALPLRVTHNDTKLNNILIDAETGKGLCVIDLDTVMPGLSVNDFGDSIRFGASTGAEDERDLSKVSCDLSYFEAFSRGFLQGCAGALTQAELDSLIDGAIMMTLECGIRFLTDHLEGDHYFKIHRENHNLDRARTQFKLVRDMEHKRSQMEAILRKTVMEVQEK